jgi:5'-methylthioadenosine phosphorylase
MTSSLPRASVAVIGGSGFYSLLEDAEAVTVTTPYGQPSDDIMLGTLAGLPVAFLPRHGRGHRFPPHRVPYRANLWALRALGVRQVISLSAVGSLTSELGPGALVVPDQLVDRTYGREYTIFDEIGSVMHVSLADPYCPRGRAAAIGTGIELTPDGALVVINGPRFSTRAESLDYQASGWTIIGMTGMPEANLARELALCYTCLALVTDHDAGVEVGGGVTHAEVMATFADNVPRLRELLVRTLERLPVEQSDCSCGAVYADVPSPVELP